MALIRRGVVACMAVRSKRGFVSGMKLLCGYQIDINTLQSVCWLGGISQKALNRTCSRYFFFLPTKRHSNPVGAYAGF